MKEESTNTDAKVTKDSKHSTKSAAIRESSMTQIIRLLSYTRYNGRYFLAGILFLIIYSSCRIFIPYFTGEVIAQIVRKESYADGTFHKLVFSMLALVLVRYEGERLIFDLYVTLVLYLVAFVDHASVMLPPSLIVQSDAISFAQSFSRR